MGTNKYRLRRVLDDAIRAEWSVEPSNCRCHRFFDAGEGGSEGTRIAGCRVISEQCGWPRVTGRTARRYGLPLGAATPRHPRTAKGVENSVAGVRKCTDKRCYRFGRLWCDSCARDRRWTFFGRLYARAASLLEAPRFYPWVTEYIRAAEGRDDVRLNSFAHSCYGFSSILSKRLLERPQAAGLNLRGVGPMGFVERSPIRQAVPRLAGVCQPRYGSEGIWLRPFGVRGRFEISLTARAGFGWLCG